MSRNMERLLQPDKFATLHSDIDADKKWQFWRTCFENFVEEIPHPEPPFVVNKLKLLINHIDHGVYNYISTVLSYEDAMSTLDALYKAPVNVISARHILATRKQDPSQSLKSFLQDLKNLAKPCQFTLPATVLEYEEEYIRDSFITGLHSPVIRQRLLEERTLTLSEAYDKASALEMAQTRSQVYQGMGNVNAIPAGNYRDEMAEESTLDTPDVTCNAAPRRKFKPGRSYQVPEHCSFCGGTYHDRSACPASGVQCYACNKKGHFQKMCRNPDPNARKTPNQQRTVGAIPSGPKPPSLSSIVAGAPSSLSQSASSE